MKTYIALWKARQSWMNLSQEERAKYMGKLERAIQLMLEKGVEVIAWGVIDNFTFRRIDYDFFAVLRFTDTLAIQELEKLLEDVGWHHYFDQANAMGYTQTPQEIIPLMISM